MYVPPLYRQNDMTAIRQFIREARLASLVTVKDGRPLVSHVPVMLVDDDSTEHGRLICHLAANQQVATLNGPALITFLADDAYIHPGWYESTREHRRVVPTWNYIAVHISGEARTIEDPTAVHSLVEQLTDHHEQHRETRWQVNDAPADFIEGMLRGIVGVEIEIQSIEAKWKLGQDETAADFAGAISGLDKSDDARDRAAAN